MQSDQVHRIYVDELGDPEQLSLGVALLVLTNVSEREAPEQARRLLAAPSARRWRSLSSGESPIS